MLHRASLAVAIVFDLLAVGLRAQHAHWTQADVWPFARRDASIAIDAARGRVLCFGGYPGLNDLWEYADGVFRVVPAFGARPSLRFACAMACDSARDRLVLQGGVEWSGNFVNDTWEFDLRTSRWSQVATGPQRPVAEPYQPMVYEPRIGACILFEGLRQNGTWKFDGSTWQRLAVTGSPSVRLDAHMVFDPMRGRVLLHGGFGNGNQLDDTWEFDALASTWSPIVSAHHPPGRSDAEVLFDPARGRTVWKSTAAPQQMWEYDGIDWQRMTELAVPDDRFAAAVFFDPVRRRPVLWAGLIPDPIPTLLDDVWEFDPGQRQWIRVPRIEHLGRRFDHAIAADPVRGDVMLFGGYDMEHPLDGPSQLRFDGTTWRTETVPTPPTRHDHAMTTDTRRARVVLFGGQSPTGQLLRDTWEWDGVAWTELHPPSNGLGPLAQHAMCYDPDASRVLVYGGLQTTAGRLEPRLFELPDSVIGWREVVTATAPPTRRASAIAYDKARHRLVMFGGETFSGVLGDTWEFDGTDWIQMSPTHPPAARSHHTLHFDSRIERVVLFGGATFVDDFADAWTWDGHEWHELAQSSWPQGRTLHAVAYDPVRRTAVIAGGKVQLAGSTVFGDTWTFELDDVAKIDAFGSRCFSGNRVPLLRTDEAGPWLGEQMNLVCVGLDPATSAMALGVLGLSDRNFGGAALPLWLGVPGCSLLVSAESVTPLAVAAGSAQWVVHVPLDPGVVGSVFFAQCLGVESGVTPSGLVPSNAIEMQIGWR